jgi:hypothetical protein
MEDLSVEGVPSDVLHRFACDCAGRTLGGGDEHRRIIEALDVKRSWAVDGADDAELAEAIAEIREASDALEKRLGRGAIDDPAWLATRAALGAMDADPVRAATRAAEEAARAAGRTVYLEELESEGISQALQSAAFASDAERIWQIQRLEELTRDADT